MPCSRINTAVWASCKMLPRNCGNSATTSLSKAICRAVGKSTPTLGESKIDPRNRHPCASFHQLGHRSTLSGRFPTETIHDCIVDVERRLHMENHIGYMAVCQTPNPGRLHAFGRDISVNSLQTAFEI